MNISCYVVDDEPDAVELLEEYIRQTPGLSLKGATQNPLVALEEITSPPTPDLTFVDIDMRQLSGMELAGMVNLYTLVVFTTAHPQFALQAFEKEAFDYLVKPFNYERFLRCIQKAKKQFHKPAPIDHPPEQSFFNIKSDIKGKMIKIEFDEVVYIESAQNYIRIHTLDESHLTYLTMQEIELHLPRHLFARIHRSFIINIGQVKVVERNQIRLKNDQSFMMGEFYKQTFLDMMDAHLIKTKRTL